MNIRVLWVTNERWEKFLDVHFESRYPDNNLSTYPRVQNTQTISSLLDYGDRAINPRWLVWKGVQEELLKLTMDVYDYIKGGGY